MKKPSENKQGKIKYYREEGAVIAHDPAKTRKTGDWRFMRPEVNLDKCDGCGICVKFCPEATMELVERCPLRKETQKSQAAEKSREVVQIDYDYCKGCGVCAAVCPVRAIIMKKEN